MAKGATMSIKTVIYFTPPDSDEEIIGHSLTRRFPHIPNKGLDILLQEEALDIDNLYTIDQVSYDPQQNVITIAVKGTERIYETFENTIK